MAELILYQNGERFVLPFEEPARLADVLAAGGFARSQPCGGRGQCGKCRVRLNGMPAEMNAAERAAGTHLICQAVLLGDVEARLDDTNSLEQIELSGETCMQVSEPMPGKFGAAVDIGTTTIALRILDMKTGATLASAGMGNPQTAVAADVMGRIGAALEGRLDELNLQVRTALDRLIERGCRQAGIGRDELKSMVVCGNTTMLYLLAGRDPRSLACAPFEADCLFDEDMDLDGAKAYLPPCMNAFVGADIGCAVLASGMTERPETALLIDIGTNGEIALWKDGKLYVTSTAAGPAFEGAGISCGMNSIRGAIDRAWVQDGEITVHTIGGVPAAGVCGSGLIDAIACMLKTGMIEDTGGAGLDELSLGGVCLLPRDVRAVQLAKAAIAAGIETLMECAGAGMDEIRTLYIAGGFGRHLNVRSAARIGLIPAALTDRVQVLGNAALAGAAQLLVNGGALKRMRSLAGMHVHVNLGGNPAFNEHYIDQMFFPED